MGYRWGDHRRDREALDDWLTDEERFRSWVDDVEEMDERRAALRGEGGPDPRFVRHSDSGLTTAGERVTLMGSCLVVIMWALALIWFVLWIVRSVLS